MCFADVPSWTQLSHVRLAPKPEGKILQAFQMKSFPQATSKRPALPGSGLRSWPPFPTQTHSLSLTSSPPKPKPVPWQSGEQE